MQFRIKTSVLQEMVAKSIKGASNNKIVPITCLMGIELSNGTLTISTTDAANYLKVLTQNIEGDNLYAVVQADIFSKLISKTTTDEIFIKLTDVALEIRGNGNYQLDLLIDEEGRSIRFPNYTAQSLGTIQEEKIINLSAIKTILNANKYSIATTIDTPYLTGYYFGDRVITTDRNKMCATDIKFFNNPILLPASLIELLSIMDEEQIKYQRSGNKVLFTTSNVIIYGNDLEGINEYPVDALNQFLNIPFPSYCKVSTNDLLNLLDRLSLFVSTYDENGIYLTFSQDGISVNSKKNNGYELVSYQDSKDFSPFTCCASILLLKDQIATQKGESLNIWYGQNQVLKMQHGNITQVTALLTDDRGSSVNA